MEHAENVGGGLRALDATSQEGTKYLADMAWARCFADASRKVMAEQVGVVVESVLGARLRWETSITTDHNHVALERHGGCELWVHRKGSMPAALGQAGVLPGSMGSSSFHVEGRGHEAALSSSALGAGRALSRTAARAKVTDREFRRQMEGVWYDYRLSDKLRDEAPAAYKDIKAVLRAQRDLVKVTRALRPVLNYKGA
jgi:tRNA-splicing ligase RtcB